MAKTRAYQILCVDDEADILLLLKEIVEDEGFICHTFSHPKDAMEHIQVHAQNIALIISDFNMGEINGFEFRKMILDAGLGNIPFTILSGFVSKEMALEGLKYRVSSFRDKPFDQSLIEDIIKEDSEARIEELKEEEELIAGFVDETELLLEEIEPLAMALEDEGNHEEELNRIFAVIHTIKGTSGFFSPPTIHKFAHALEEILGEVKNGQRAVTAEVVSILLSGLDTIGRLNQKLKERDYSAEDVDALCKIFEHLKAKDKNAVKETQETRDEDSKDKSSKKTRDEIRVSTKLLDEFMEHSGEITVLRNMIIKLVRSIEKEHPGNKDVLLLSELLEEMHKINSSLQDRVGDLRKVPLKSVYRPFARAVRDLTVQLEKKIEFKTDGEALRVDTAIAEVMSNSLIHMVRNCVDHGIELPEEREKANKPDRGTIQLITKMVGEEILVSLIDDGKGIDPKQIGKKLVEKGMCTPEELAEMPDQRILLKIFEPGFSTAEKVTNVSGRGVGMDMVKGSVDKLGGRLEVQSTVGKGTHIDMHLPIPKTVLIMSSLMVEAGGRAFSIPQDQIVRLLRLEKEEAKKSIGLLEGARILRLANEMLPLLRLSDLLGLPSNSDGESCNLVVLKTRKCKFVIEVDEIFDIEDNVVKKLSSNLKDLSIFMGATFLGDGSVGLILNAEGIATQADLQEQELALSEPHHDEHSSSEPENEFIIVDLPVEGRFGIPTPHIFRLEEFDPRTLKYSGKQPMVIYRKKPMPIFPLHQLLGLQGKVDLFENPTLPTLIVEQGGHHVGILVQEIKDRVATRKPMLTEGIDRPGVLANVVLDEKVVTVADLEQLIQQKLPRAS